MKKSELKQIISEEISKVLNESAINKIDRTKKVEILKKIKEYGYSWKEIFDPVQTHVFYEVDKDDIPELKSELKAGGASKFRTIKNKNTGNYMLAFDASKM
jgi:hypothetical protein